MSPFYAIAIFPDTCYAFGYQGRIPTAITACKLFWPGLPSSWVVGYNNASDIQLQELDIGHVLTFIVFLSRCSRICRQMQLRPCPKGRDTVSWSDLV
jgi:hypothetical protein